MKQTIEFELIALLITMHILTWCLEKILILAVRRRFDSSLISDNILMPLQAQEQSRHDRDFLVTRSLPKYVWSNTVLRPAVEQWLTSAINERHIYNMSFSNNYLNNSNIWFETYLSDTFYMYRPSGIPHMPPL